MFNWAKTFMLMAGFAALLVLIGGAVGGQMGMLIALAIAVAMNFWAYWNSDKMVLRMYNAKQVDDLSAPEYYQMVQELAAKAEMPMPKVYIIDEAAPNAFATGRSPNHAAVAATTGILRVLSARELRGVMAHELAHVKNRDILISTISAVGAEISGDPEALANALRKISGYAEQVPLGPAEEHPETAQMMIMNPLSGGGLSGMFSTHPATEERVARLMAMARRTG